MVQHLFFPWLFCNGNGLSYVAWEHSTLSLRLITALIHLKCLAGRMGKLLEIISKQIFQFRCSVLFPSSISPVHSYSPQCVFAEHAEGREAVNL